MADSLPCSYFSRRDEEFQHHTGSSGFAYRPDQTRSRLSLFGGRNLHLGCSSLGVQDSGCSECRGSRTSLGARQDRIVNRTEATRPRWLVYLRLGRISNLPTVWTNCLAGMILAGGTVNLTVLAPVLTALSF